MRGFRGFHRFTGDSPFPALIAIIVLTSLICSLTLCGCAPKQAEAPSPTAPSPAAPHAIVKIDNMGSAFGSNTYIMAMAMSQLLEKKHPWLRLNVAEGPGCSGSTFGMLTKPEEWKERMCCTMGTDFFLATNGIAPYKEKIPDMKDRVKVIGMYSSSVTLLYTMNPNIKSVEDLAGKTVALGKAAQYGWATLPVMLMERVGIKAKFDYLDPNLATEAMIDGRADAAALSVPSSPDGSVVEPPQPLQAFLAAQKTPYYITFGQKMVDQAKKEGWTGLMLPTEMPAGSLPQQKVSVIAAATPTNFAMHPSYPEEPVYEFCKFWLQNTKELTEACALFRVSAKPEWIAVQSNTQDITHPGAWKAWKEFKLR